MEDVIISQKGDTKMAKGKRKVVKVVKKALAVKPQPETKPMKMSFEQLAMELGFQHQQLANANANVNMINQVLKDRMAKNATK